MGTKKKPLKPVPKRAADGPAVLAIDPGWTTGWAYMAPWDGVFTGTFGGDGVEYEAETRKLIKRFAPDQIVIERMPREMDQRTGAITALIENAVVAYGKGHSRIAPGEWKPVTNKHALPFEMETQHEKDAFRMGMFYLYKCHFIPRPIDMDELL